MREYRGGLATYSYRYGAAYNVMPTSYEMESYFTLNSLYAKVISTLDGMVMDSKNLMKLKEIY